VPENEDKARGLDCLAVGCWGLGRLRCKDNLPTHWISETSVVNVPVGLAPHRESSPETDARGGRLTGAREVCGSEAGLMTPAAGETQWGRPDIADPTELTLP